MKRWGREFEAPAPLGVGEGRVSGDSVGVRTPLGCLSGTELGSASPWDLQLLGTPASGTVTGPPGLSLELTPSCLWERLGPGMVS